tara:strand:- start:1087 stop:2079 length:993 start_codon:yes stop_codon:yes gene_type:complete
MFNKKSILITGGTGSFGQQMTRKILKEYKPKKLIIFSRDELKQHQMQINFKNNNIRYFIGDVRDYTRLKTATKSIDFIIHAAALKQVPIAEYNPFECIKTNIYGAENIINCAIENNVKKVLALSTDKAANPINLYGASKLASDKLFIAGNNMAGKNGTRFSVVRYGNVFNSRGSVVPLFLNMFRNGRTSLPVTHKDMTRFSITLEEGANFVLKSMKIMQGGEIFVPKIPSYRILDLVKAITKKSNYKITKIRPGEKINEVMCPQQDSHLTIEFKDHYVIMPAISFENKINYMKNKLGQKGKKVKDSFEYSSNNNEHFLSITDLQKLIKKI